MDSLNSVVEKVLGDEWGLFWTAAGIFLALVVKICGETEDLKRSEKARKARDYIVALASILATFAALTVAWFVAVETSGNRQEWWSSLGPFVCIGIALLLCGILLAVAITDNKSVADDPESHASSETAEGRVAGHAQGSHAAETSGASGEGIDDAALRPPARVDG